MFHCSHCRDSEIHRKLDQVLELLNTNQKKTENLMAALDDKIAELKAAVAEETSVEQSAITLINGIPALIADAVSKAQAAGATPAQLQALTDLQTSIASNATGLQSAVTANTPAAAPAP